MIVQTMIVQTMIVQTMIVQTMVVSFTFLLLRPRFNPKAHAFYTLKLKQHHGERAEKLNHDHRNPRCGPGGPIPKATTQEKIFLKILAA